MMARVMLAIDVTIYEMFAKEIKCQMLDLANEGQGQEGEKRDLHLSTANL